MEPAPVCLSVGIMAWNEQDSLPRTLDSLFRQTVFARLAARGQRCEVICLANGCKDNTVGVAAEVFTRMERGHPDRAGLSARAVDIPQPGRNNAWNRFVHELSAPESRFICLMDADIIFFNPDTLYNLVAALEADPEAAVATGRQFKNILFRKNKSLRDRLSLATSDMTGTIAGRFSGQNYCLRAEVARRLYLPRDLGATDDGFLKAIICTDFLAHPPEARRIALAPDAGHIFEPYLSAGEILNNQKRQMIGQTSVHVILAYLRTLPPADRADLAVTFRREETRDPDWLRQRLDQHVRSRRFFWQLFPGILGFRWRRLRELRGRRRLTLFPAALAGFIVTLLACWQAHRFLRGGGRTSYWPKAARGAWPAPPIGSNPAPGNP